MISKHISDRESVYSRTALRLGIDNTPTEEHKKNMIKLAEEVFEPLRTYVGGPIKINSFENKRTLRLWSNNMGVW